MHDTQITLISIKVLNETTDTGEPITEELNRNVYAVLQGVKRNEFYQAQALGLKPEIVFSVHDFEYHGEKIVEHEGKRWNVIRSYPARGERLELICNGLAELR
jgi:SPP1 family predicted phage head-tail adaptor